MKKIMMFIIILTFLLVLSAEENLRHGLGFTGGMISGSGFSYRQMNENYGFQFALGAITIGEGDDIEFDEIGFWEEDTLDTYTMEDEGVFYYTNFGASYYKFLHKGEKSLFYFLVGTAAYINFGSVKEQIYGYNPDTQLWETLGESTEETEVTVRTNFGIGIGINYKLTNNIHLNLDRPFVYSRCYDDFDLIMYIPQAGIHYYFK